MTISAADHVVSRMNLYAGKFCFFVGAGISVCAGIPLATVDLPDLPSIVTRIRWDYYESLGNSPISDKKLLMWYADHKLLQIPETLYSDALNLIGDTPRCRQEYLFNLFDGITPGQCHKSISCLVEKGFVEVILTTNFDSLIEDAIHTATKSSPKTAAHNDSVRDVLVTEKVPRVIKLHGDYLFSDIKNTTTETATLTENMREKLRAFLGEKGLIVIGYSGGDNSIMSLFEQMAYDGGFFPYGVIWLQRKDSPVSERVRKFLEMSNAVTLEIVNAEQFLEEVVDRCRTRP